MDPAATGWTPEAVVSLVTAILTFIVAVLGWMGKKAEAKKAKEALALTRAVTGAIEKHKASTGDKTVIGMVSSVAYDAGVQKELDDLLIELGYKKPKGGA